MWKLDLRGLQETVGLQDQPVSLETDIGLVGSGSQRPHVMSAIGLLYWDVPDLEDLPDSDAGTALVRTLVITVVVIQFPQVMGSSTAVSCHTS